MGEKMWNGCVRLPGPAYGQLSQLCGQISGQEQLQDPQPGETMESVFSSPFFTGFHNLGSSDFPSHFASCDFGLALKS